MVDLVAETIFQYPQARIFNDVVETRLKKKRTQWRGSRGNPRFTANCYAILSFLLQNYNSSKYRQVFTSHLFAVLSGSRISEASYCTGEQRNKRK